MSARKFIRQRRLKQGAGNGSKSKPFEIADLLDVIGNERELERMSTFAANIDDWLYEGRSVKMLANENSETLRLLVLKIKKFLGKFEDGAVVRVNGKDWRLTEVDAEEFEVETEQGDKTIARYRVSKGADNDNDKEE